MARRRGPGRWSEDQVDELGVGRFGFHPRLRQRQCTVEAWCPQCSNGWHCSSYFQSREEAERCYWDNRAELMSLELPTNRPLGWWWFEAARWCQHDPACALPQGSRERDDWLDVHGLLSAEERALLARTGPPSEAGRLEDDDG